MDIIPEFLFLFPFRLVLEYYVTRKYKVTLVISNVTTFDMLRYYFTKLITFVITKCKEIFDLHNESTNVTANVKPRNGKTYE